MPRTTCAECGGPIKQPKGRGRRRVYCGAACRNTAYEHRRGVKPTAADLTKDVKGNEVEIGVGDVLQLPQLHAAREERLQWIDSILDSPVLTHDLFNELLCRIALGLVLEDMRYQAAVNDLVVIYRMIARITDGTFRLPIVIV